MPTKYTACFSREIATKHIVPPANTILISMTDPDGEVPVITACFSEIYKFRFWDFDRGRARLSTSLAGYTHHGPDENDLDLLYDIICKHQNQHIFAHCEAGISRSGAIREFLERMGWVVLSSDWQIHPNQYILKGLIQRQREQGKIEH